MSLKQQMSGFQEMEKPFLEILQLLTGNVNVIYDKPLKMQVPFCQVLACHIWYYTPSLSS